MAKVLITGGTGLVGSRILHFFLQNGHEVHILSRSKKGVVDGIRYWEWDIKSKFIEGGALNVDHIIHLAGAGVVDERWTEARKKEIMDSRVLSTRLIFNNIKASNYKVKSIASASAVGYYGDRGSEILKEDVAPGQGFLTDVCVAWENEAKKFQTELGISTAIVRVGIVLSKNDGALPKLDLPIKFGIGAYLGNGKQYYPWIHIDDISQIFVYTALNQLEGTFNGCAPTPMANKQIGKTIAKVLKRPFIPAPGPKFILKTFIGEKAQVLFDSQNTSAEKIINAGFKFQFPELEGALEDIYQRGV